MPEKTYVDVVTEMLYCGDAIKRDAFVHDLAVEIVDVMMDIDITKLGDYDESI